MNLSNGVKVLVAGGAGFLGTNLIVRLLERGVTVRATYHVREPQLQDARIDWVQCDLTNREACNRACEGMDVLIITSAFTAGAMVIEKSPLSMLNPNLIMNTQLMEAAYTNGLTKLCFISSNTVYPVSDQPMKETQHTGEYFSKYHIVASMKYFSERIAQMYGEHVSNRMQVSVIRPGNMYGPYDDFEWETSHVLPAFIRRIVERHDPISVWGDGEDIKDFVYVDDVVDGILLALEKDSNYAEYNIAAGQGYCLKQLLRVLMKIEQHEAAKVEFDATKPSMIPIRLIDIEKASQELGYFPKTSIEDGLKKTIEWYRQSR